MSFPSLFTMLAQRDLLRNWTRTKACKYDVPRLPKELDAKVKKIALSSTQCWAIGDSSFVRRFEARRWRSPHRAPRVRDDSGRSPRSRRTVGRRAPRVRDDSGRSPRSRRTVARRARSGSREPKLQESLPPSPQGRLRHQRPRSAGYDCVINATVREGAGYGCRNNTTVLRRPEAVGWAPLVCAGPLTTSLWGLWVSGLLPPGNGGTNEGAATQKPTERHKGAATQKPTSERRNSRSNLGARGGDPRNPGVVAPLLFCKLSPATCWWD